MNRTFKHITSVILFITLTLTSVARGDDEDASAITSVWTSVIESSEFGLGTTVVGWVLSAIGLARGTNQTNELKEIASELETINKDLEAINSTLEQILNAIKNQTCTQLESGTDLEIAVNNIQSLFNDYQQQFIQQAQQGNPVLENQLATWLVAVMDEDSGVAQNLTTINTSVLRNTANIIETCTSSITSDYLADTTSGGPLGNPFNDSAYYAGIQNIINYYYGIQVLGSAILAEALHLQATCAKAGGYSSTNETCDFSKIAGLSIPPSTPDEVCKNPTGDTATFCSEANLVITDPQTGSGAYERVTSQLITAGAPYSWDKKMGLVWGTSILMPSSLEDFTNSAVFSNGSKITPDGCATPLNSNSACGYTVGQYNKQFDAGIQYVYGGNSDQVLWNNFSSKELDTNKIWSMLFETYNKKRFSSSNAIDTGGSAADYMNSIGFTDANHKIITVDETSKAWGKSGICNVFTEPKISMPFCSGLDDSSHVCSATASSDDCKNDENPCDTCSIEEAKAIGDVIDTKTYANGFYYLKYQCSTLILSNGKVTSCDYKDKPGWLTDVADDDKFHQFRWPMLNIKDLADETSSNYCSLRKGTSSIPGYLNSAGQYTMCGSDLQAYIDQLIPKPGTNISQTLNSTSLKTGDTLSVSSQLSNFGSATEVDVYMGAISPDGNHLTFVTSLNPLSLGFGKLDDPTSFLPLSKARHLDRRAVESFPGILFYTFSGHEANGEYQFFTLLSRSDSFNDGMINAGDIVSVHLNRFTFETR